jgi:hypothetical protein
MVGSKFNWQVLFLVALGGGFGVFWFYLGRKLAIPRFYFMAGLALVLGLGLCFFCAAHGNGDFLYVVNSKTQSYIAFGNYYEIAFGDFFVGLGVAGFSLGGLVFRRYLKNNPLPVASEQGQVS